MSRIVSRLVVLLFITAGLGLVGCQVDTSKIPSADEMLDKAQQATDKAQVWVDENRDVVRRVDRMWRAYEAGNMEEAQQELTQLRERVNWDEGLLANDELRSRVLEGGTQIYDSLNQPEKAQALLRDVLPHLDGPTRQKWEAALEAYQNADSGAGTSEQAAPPADE